MRYHLVLLTLFFNPALLLHAQNYSKDVKMGEKAAKQVEVEMGFYKHDSIEKLINKVGQKLVANLKKKPKEFDFKFYLVDQAEPNAFALPGGYIYVTRGIIPIIQSEDELAGVIGHEIIHIIKRHSVKQFRRQIFPAVLKLPGNLINTITFSRLGNILNVPIGWITDPFIAKYSRKHERESDKLGIQLAADAGYDPASLSKALARLSKGVESMTGQAEKKSYLADHPYTPSRVKNINKLSTDIPAKQPSRLYATNEKFLSMFNGLCYGNNPKNGAFVDSLFVHPQLNFSMFMPSGWTRENSTNAVAAVSKEKDAAVALSLAPEKKSPKELGEDMRKKIRTSSSTKINFAGDTTIHSLPAYLLRVSSVKKNEPVILEVIWISHNNLVYQFTGLSGYTNRKAVSRSLRSFKTSTPNEIKEIKMGGLKIVSSGNNESADELSKRTNNQLTPELMLILNDLSKGSKLPANKIVKVVELLPYKP